MLCVSALNGEDYDPHFYIQARDPDGQVRGNAEILWHWEDVPGRPCKWQVWDLQGPFLIFKEGVFTVGIYENRDDPNEKALSVFSLPIFFDDSLPPAPRGVKLPPGAVVVRCYRFRQYTAIYADGSVTPSSNCVRLSLVDPSRCRAGEAAPDRQELDTADRLMND